VPEKFTAFLPRFLQMMQSGRPEAPMVLQLFGEIAKRNPEVGLSLVLGRIECMKCGILLSMIPGVCQSVILSRGFAKQTWLNGSRSSLGWRLLGAQGT